jgi:hypothetical protein
VSRECVTHHCDCREAEFAAIKAERDDLLRRIAEAPRILGYHGYDVNGVRLMYPGWVHALVFVDQPKKVTS